MPGECKKGSLPLSLCQYLLVKVQIAGVQSAEKQILKASKKRKILTVCKLDVVSSVVRGEERYGVERESVINPNLKKRGLKADVC